MSIEMLQQKLNEQADQKLLKTIRTHVDSTRNLADMLKRILPNADIDKQHPSVLVEAEVSPIGDGPQKYIMARVRTGQAFYDALETALFNAARDAARMEETTRFMATVETQQNKETK